MKYAEVREKIRTFKRVRFVAAQVVGRGRTVPTARQKVLLLLMI